MVMVSLTYQNGSLNGDREKQFCACKSFQEWCKVDAGDLLYSALRGVEGALKALSGSGDDTSSLRRRMGDANLDEASTGS